MAGSRLQLLFLCYRDSGDSLLLKHNGHLSPRGVIQIQYQLKVIPILFSPALQHIYCCAVQLKALPGPGAARRAPVCASLPGGFGTLPGGYGVEEAGQSRGGSAGLGAGSRCGGSPAAVPRRAAGAARSAPAGRTFRAPWKLGAPWAAGAEGGSGSQGSAARPQPPAFCRGDLPGPAAERPRPPALASAGEAPAAGRDFPWLERGDLFPTSWAPVGEKGLGKKPGFFIFFLYFFYFYY